MNKKSLKQIISGLELKRNYEIRKGLRPAGYRSHLEQLSM